MNNSVLVTGGCGFIGSHFVRHWNTQYPDATIVVLDAMTYAVEPSNRAELASLNNVQVVEGSIDDSALVRQMLGDFSIRTVTHFAAESHVDNSIHNPGIFIQTNVVGTQVLLDAAREVWKPESGEPHRFHHVSTDEVFGMLGEDDPAFNESTPYNPSSPYSASKAASDHLVQSYHHTYGLNTVITNCSNNYGPHQHDEKLIPTVIRACLHGKPIPVYGQGLNIRDWLYVTDHCIAIEQAVKRAMPGSRYCIGGRCEVRNIEIVKILCTQIDALFAAQPDIETEFSNCPAANRGSCLDLISYVDDRPGHDWRYAIDDSLFESDVTAIERHNLAEGLAKTLAFYVEKYSVGESRVLLNATECAV